MPFGATVAGDVFQHKLDQCFGMINRWLSITDDIMIVGKQQNHGDHDLALKTLVDTADSAMCNWTWQVAEQENWSRLILGNIYYK